jgi:hypothetical protein
VVCLKRPRKYGRTLIEKREQAGDDLSGTCTYYFRPDDALKAWETFAIFEEPSNQIRTHFQDEASNALAVSASESQIKAPDARVQILEGVLRGRIN